MDSRQWREALRVDLRRQNLPAAYIDRLVEELSDHLLDIQTENSSMDAHSALACLGSPNNISAAAGQEFRRRTFVGRHPWLTFVASPFLVAPLAFVLFALSLTVLLSLVGGALELAGRRFTDNPLEDSILFAIAQAYNLLMRFAPFVIAAWFYCRLAKSSGRDRWAIAACGILGLVAGLLVSRVTPATDKFYPSSWIIGLGYPPHLHQLFQVLAPLAISAWFLLRLRRPTAPASTAAI